jgi:hypothetical protein
MTPTPSPDPNPATVGHKTLLIEIEVEGVELTPEELNRPRYGRPNPRRYLDASEFSPEQPGETPPDKPPTTP